MIPNLARGLTLAFALSILAVQAQAAQYAAIVMDARTGAVIHSDNADTKLHPASLTKMMTLYIVFDQIRRGRLSLDQKITISSNAASQPPSKLGLRAGTRIELRYLIRAAAIKSANDAATALGEAVSGSEAAFARLMTQYARAMGLKSTTFKNAHGLTATGHMSTAREMATLGRRLQYDFPQYYNLFSRSSTSAGIRTVSNTNRRLLDAYPGADGIKTGYTRAAGFNLVSSAKRGDRRVIVAVMGARSSASRNAEVAKLMDLGFSKMPRYAGVATFAPLQMTSAVASAAPDEVVAVQGSTASVLARSASLAGSRVTLIRSARPMPRALGRPVEVARQAASIAAAIAEVNSELTVAQATREAPLLSGLVERPAPRPGTAAAAATAVVVSAAASPGSASTFAVAPAPAPEPREDELEPIRVASASGAGKTGGSDWGVQLGAFRSKGDAERQLLTIALQDVPELDGGLRRVEAASVQGVTIFRAQFVGLNQQDAQGACQSLARSSTDCMTLAPGI